MSRPTDWDAIGLESDPTPGDPTRIHTVADSLAALGRTARDIDTAMETVLNKTGPEAFAGQTADELRNQIGNRLRGFVQSIADAFEWSSSALTTYADTMADSQARADGALDQGRGLSADDPNRAALATTATTAGDAQSAAASTATSALRKASNHIKSPVSPCAEFWEIFQWIAIALIIPALIFGGPVALAAIAVNLTIFIKTAVDFAQGKASGLALFLSALGMIAPTTRALPVLSLLSKGGQLITQGVKAGGIASLAMLKGMLTGITKPFVLLPSLHELALATGSWTKAGALWVLNIGRGTGQLGANIVKVGSLAVVNGIKGIPAFVHGFPPALADFGRAGAAWFKGELGGAKALRIILPAEGDEIGAFGVWKAMKIALVDRGVFGDFRYGAVRPWAQALGSGAGHFPAPGAIRNVNPLVDMPPSGLAGVRVNVGQWTSQLGTVPPPRLPGAVHLNEAGLYLPNPPALQIGTGFGDAITFSVDATTRMDALLDTPVRELSSVRLGEWANIARTPDGFAAGPGVSALPAPVANVLSSPPVHPNVSNAAAQAGTPGPAISDVTHTIAPGHVVAQATNLVMPSPGPVVHATTPPIAPASLSAPPSPHMPVTLTSGIGDITPGMSPADTSSVHTLATGPNPVAVHALTPSPNPTITSTAANAADGHVLATTAERTSLDLGPVPGIGRTAENVTPSPAAGLNPAGGVPAPPPWASLATPPPISAPPLLSHSSTAIGDLATTGKMATDVKGKGPAPLFEPGSVTPPPSERIDAAMNLLDNGAAARTVPVPAPLPAGGHALDGPALPGAASPPPGIGDKAFAGAPGHGSASSVSHAVTHGQPRLGPPPRLTGKELDQAWAVHDERIGALFGAADDPLRPQRFEAWSGFVLARGDLARTQQHLDHLRTFPGEPSSGVSPAIAHAHNDLDAAGRRFGSAVRGLREQGINPVALDQAITDLNAQSVLERPRLLGGAIPVIRVEGADQGRLVEVVPLSDATGRPQGMSVHITYRTDGTDIRVDTAEEPNGSGAYTASVLDGGGLLVHDVRTGGDRSFGSAGLLGQERIPLRGAGGHLFGDGIVVRHGPDGVTGHELTGARPSPHAVTPTAGGGFRVDRPAGEGTGAVYQLFDSDGLHLWDGHGIRTGGTDMGSVEFPAPGRGDASRWLDPNGTPVPGVTITREADAAGGPAAIRVQGDVGGEFTRYDLTEGAAIGFGTPLRGGDGALDGRFAVIPVEGTGAGHIEDLTGAPLPGRVVEDPGGGIRVEYGGGGGSTYQRFDAGNVHVSDGRRLFDQHGDPVGAIDTPLDTRVDRFLDAQWQDVPGRTTRIDPGVDGAGGAPTIRVTDIASGDYRTFDVQTGRLGDDAVMLHGADGPLNRFGVTRYPPHDVHNPEHLGLDANGAGLDHLTFHGDDGWRLTQRDAGIRTGEYRRFDAAGTLTGQRVNVTQDGTLVPGRHFDIAFTTNARTWRLVDGDGVAMPGLLHSGTVDVASDAGRIRLFAKPGASSVEIFDRRPLPDGAFLDSVRRTDVDGFGRWSGGQRTRWTQYTGDGMVTNWGVRRFGTMDGKNWIGYDHLFRPVHEFRQGVGGTVFGYKNGDRWSWARYDREGRVPIAGGPRTRDLDGGWTDRLGDEAGTVVQRQWGPLHAPQNNAGHYREVTLDANGVPESVTVHRNGDTITKHLWNGQSQQGKPTGAAERLPDGSLLETHRWSEQRPPQWVRQAFMGIRKPVWDAHPHLKGDTKYQMFRWTRTDVTTGAEIHGYRFTSMNEGTLDIAADGRMLQATVKLDNGHTLKVGDSVRPLAGVAPDPRFKPWSEGTGRLSGHRVEMNNVPDGRIWEDHFDPAAGGGDWYHPLADADWQVARIGFKDGTVREFKVGDGNIVDRDVWVTKNPHGVIVARSDRWPMADGVRHRIEMTAPVHDDRWNFTGYDGRADTQSWYWVDHDAANGAHQTGPARNMRGYNGATPFDDSFVHFERGDRGIEAVRVRNMLGGGEYVDSWRVTGPDGTHGWEWAKFGRNGRMADYPGVRTRQWWNPRLNGGRGGWASDWSKGATRFQDVVTPPGDAAIVVREIPPTAVNGRIREFLAGGDTPPPAGTWKEFDHGAVVRQRQALPEGGGFLETDVWLGQWRRYNIDGRIVAQRTSAGFVFEANGLNLFRLTGREFDFRGPLTELRGWGRRIREANRLEWKFAAPGAPRLGEAVYRPQARLIAEKAAIEFVQEFVLEFTANLAVNAIVADIQNRPFTGKDALKAFANASVSSGIKTGVGTLVHDNRIGALRHTGDWRMGLANIDGGKPWNRHPFNHDKHWSNEWAGNEVPIRWRGGTYDFTYNAGVSVLSGWVNGSMNAAVFGFGDSRGNTVTVHGGAAALDGLINAASSLTGTVSSSLGKNLYMYGVGSRGFHRQGVGEFVTSFAFKIPEKLTTWELTNVFRDGNHLNPPWYDNGTGKGGQPQ